MSIPPTEPLSVTPAQYVAAIAQHVSSVCIVTTATDGERFGLTATAMSSVTAEPPRLLVCVNKSGRSYEAIIASGRFCVNVLTEAQDKVAMIFAGHGGSKVDRFANGDWTKLSTGAPVLIGAAASFDCRLGQVVDQSTHAVLIGDVVSTTHQVGQDTLLYGARRFRQLRKIFMGASAGGEYL
ncbi:hypothetical protein AU467_16515 [Mesorhizobium loti]|uniref:Flavin reductase like domain-containing protein n=1 Tax=Rhizobium loti TaxID=381 RepID=A0A124GGQ4_RHILI|nr:hypothetical protein AU467_16515 [Mesorhizobium loti]